MRIRLNKTFKGNIKALFKREDSVLTYNLEGTFKVVQKDFTGEGNLLVRANQEKIYNTMVVLSEHYEIVN